MSDDAVTHSLIRALQQEILSVIERKGVRAASRALGITANGRLGSFQEPTLFKLVQCQVPKAAFLARQLLVERGYQERAVNAVASGRGARVVAFEEFRRHHSKRNRAPCASTQSVQSFYMHAALQLLVVDFPNFTFVNALVRKGDVDEIQTAAMFALLTGFSDLGFFVAAALSARHLSPRSRDMPVHSLSSLQLSEEFTESSQAADRTAFDNSEYVDLGRNVEVVFERAEVVSSADAKAADLVADAQAYIASGGVALYNFLEALYSCDRAPRDIREPRLVSAAAGVAACRLSLALFSASRTIINAGEENVPLPLYRLASKIGELCKFAYTDRMTAMADALRALPPCPRELADTIMSDRFRLEGDYWASRMAHADGVWFLFPAGDESAGSWAFLSECGSMIQSLQKGAAGLYAGEIWHRFDDPDKDGELPTSVDEAWASGNFIIL